MTTVTRGFKFRFYPNAVQRDLLARYFGHTRSLYNKLLDDAIKQYEVNPGYKVGGYDFINRIIKLKEEFTWLKEISNVALQQSAWQIIQSTNYYW